MAAYISSEELSLLPANRLSYPARRAVSQRPSLFARTRAFFQRQADLREMAALSDRELQDLGINRADIGHVFDDGFQPHQSR